jgi:hypothetical protein
MFNARNNYLIDSIIYMLQRELTTREDSLRGGGGLGEASGAGGTTCGKYNWFIYIVSFCGKFIQSVFLSV